MPYDPVDTRHAARLRRARFATHLSWAFACIVATSAAVAQDEPLGPSQAQLFDRAISAEQIDVVEPAGAAVPERLTARNLVGNPDPAMLLGGELRREGTYMGWAPPSLRDVALMVACDRRNLKRGRERYELPARSDLAAHTLSASFERPDDDRQTVTVTIAPNGESAGNRRAWSGTLTIERTWQDDAPLLAAFDARWELEARLTDNERKTHKVDRVAVRFDESWRHRSILDAVTPEFRTRVYRAILAGGEAVLGQLGNPKAGQFAQEEPNTHGSGTGHLALAILTALKAGIDANDETLAAAIEELRGRTITNTYCLATALMAMESLYAPIGEREALLGGRIDAPMQRKPSERDKELMQKWADQLLGNIDTTQDAAYIRRYHYHPSTSWDNSNCQYAMLGLYAAQLCGVELSPQVWYASTQHFLDCQRNENLEPIGLSIQSHAEVDAESRRSSRTVSARRKVDPAGWAYTGHGQATGSMTTAGITGLVIGTAALRQQKKLGRKLDAECDMALTRGFAWFAEHLTVRTNPTTGHGNHGWHLYYLYGLERACELSQVARIQGRDWYFEGAAWLLEGRFPDDKPSGMRLEDTCFAVLFLKKAALPVISGR